MVSCMSRLLFRARLALLCGPLSLVNDSRKSVLGLWVQPLSEMGAALRADQIRIAERDMFLHPKAYEMGETGLGMLGYACLKCKRRIAQTGHLVGPQSWSMCAGDEITMRYNNDCEEDDRREERVHDEEAGGDDGHDDDEWVPEHV